MARTSSLAPPLRGISGSPGYVKNRSGDKQPPPTPSPLKGEVGGGAASAISAATLLNEIKDLANKLEPEARQKLLAELSLANTQADGEATRDLDMWTASVQTALAALNGGGLGGLPGPAVIRRSLAVSSSWGVVLGFMRTSKLANLTVPERQGAYNLLAELVVGHAHDVSMRTAAPLGPKLVANCATNIAGIFDKAFPGYLRAGLVLAVVSRGKLMSLR